MLHGSVVPLPLLAMRLFWFDDDDRINVAVTVIFDGGVRRIVHAYSVYQELVGILAGRWIDAADPSITFFCAVVLSLDLAARVAFHNRTDSIDGHFTRKNGPWKLVWSEPHKSRHSAMRREREIKRMKSAKWIRKHLLEAAAVNPDGSGL